MGLLDKVAKSEAAIGTTGIVLAKVKRVEELTNTTTGSKGIKIVLDVEGTDIFTGYVNTVKKDGNPNDIGVSLMEKLAVVSGLDELPTERELITIGGESKPCIVGWGEAAFHVALQEVSDGQYDNLNIYELFFGDKASVAEKVNGDASHKRYDLIQKKLKPKTTTGGNSGGGNKSEPEAEEESPI